jgi:TPR repeat protein
MPSPTDDLLAIDADAMRARIAGSPADAASLLAAGARAGLPEAQALYAQILLDGRGVAADPSAALRWFGAAARAGHVMAINMVGRCYEKGWGVAADPVVAARWYQAAAEAGLDWGMYNHASALGLGAGVAKDEDAALAWFGKAAALGHAKSINVVGAFHEEGRLIPRDLAQAADCYARAAEGGDFRGQFNHARMLADAGDVDGAIFWVRTADQSCTPAFRARMQAWLAGASMAGLRAAATGLGRDDR